MPALGAEEDHVPEAADLVTGGNVTHYWEDTGIIGELYETPLEIPDVYAWDVWMAYKPGTQWTGELPPKPDYVMHQLSADAAKETMPWLDSEIFTGVVNAYLADIN